MTLVVDASCVVEVVTDRAGAEPIRARLAADQDHAAPHLVDAEVLGVIRRRHLAGDLDATAAAQSVEDLRLWRGQRYGHGALLERAWELRSSVRSWDAFYVALAEALGATLLTTDGRLSRLTGPRCSIELMG